mmetsp:Transcript_141/g.530  ORF Transcript_141/g.530 Transcript_141/m.530 type:complete len:227 (+) Transcript_141:1391-2071(+)
MATQVLARKRGNGVGHRNGTCNARSRPVGTRNRLMHEGSRRRRNDDQNGALWGNRNRCVLVQHGRQTLSRGGEYRLAADRQARGGFLCQTRWQQHTLSRCLCDLRWRLLKLRDEHRIAGFSDKDRTNVGGWIRIVVELLCVDERLCAQVLPECTRRCRNTKKRRVRKLGPHATCRTCFRPIVRIRVGTNSRRWPQLKHPAVIHLVPTRDNERNSSFPEITGGTISV